MKLKVGDKVTYSEQELLDLGLSPSGRWGTDAVQDQSRPKTCNHKWVNYQPLIGESYECCALAGCGIKRADLRVEKNENISNSSAGLLHYNDNWVVPADFFKSPSVKP